jgi:hypothetical protein
MKATPCVAIACLAAAVARPGFAGIHDDALLGCWRSTHIAQYLRNGSKLEDSSGRCTLRFTEDRMESRCTSASGTLGSTYSYTIVRPQVYAATMTASDLRTTLLGSVREYEYRVDGDRLFLVTRPPAGAAGAPAAAVRVESESARMQCP